MLPPKQLPRLLCLLAPLFGLLCQAAAQSAATGPVGFLTLNIAGADTGGTTALSFKALGLLQPAEFQALATAVSGNTISCAGAGWATDKYNGANGAFYVELIGPAGTPGLGTMYDIVATNGSTQTITLGQNLASGIANNAGFRIRKQWTIASVFGATNDKGLQGGFAST